MSDELLPEIERTAKMLSRKREEYYYYDRCLEMCDKQRDDLHDGSGWVGGTGMATIKTTWNTYRQALRDITTQTDPDSITSQYSLHK